MKKSRLREIIKEEIQNVLRDNKGARRRKIGGKGEGSYGWEGKDKKQKVRDKEDRKRMKDPERYESVTEATEMTFFSLKIGQKFLFMRDKSTVYTKISKSKYEDKNGKRYSAAALNTAKTGATVQLVDEWTYYPTEKNAAPRKRKEVDGKAPSYRVKYKLLANGEVAAKGSKAAMQKLAKQKYGKMSGKNESGVEIQIVRIGESAESLTEVKSSIEVDKRVRAYIDSIRNKDTKRYAQDFYGLYIDNDRDWELAQKKINYYPLEYRATPGAKGKVYDTLKKLLGEGRIVNVLREGFMGTSHWIESDGASDLMHNLSELCGYEYYYGKDNNHTVGSFDLAIAKKNKSKILGWFNKALNRKGNMYNLSGAEDIALVAMDEFFWNSLLQVPGVKAIKSKAARKINDDMKSVPKNTDEYDDMKKLLRSLSR